MAEAEVVEVMRFQVAEAGRLGVAIVAVPGRYQEELAGVQPQAMVMPLAQMLWPTQAVVEVAVVG
jgi:hypothetical protein